MQAPRARRHQEEDWCMHEEFRADITFRDSFIIWFGNLSDKEAIGWRCQLDGLTNSG